jgi:ribosomal protein S18 acetylase RimI-like enzyme
VTRPATDADLDVLLSLLAELRDVGGRAERALSPVMSLDLPARLRELMAGPDSAVILACIDDEPVGMVVLRSARPDPLSDCLLAQIAHLVVLPGNRHRGIGHALVDAAAGFATARGLEHIAVGVYPSLREISRFFARLGFVQTSAYRVAPVARLRRRTAPRTVPVMSDVMRRRARRLVPVQQGNRGSSEQV